MNAVQSPEAGANAEESREHAVMLQQALTDLIELQSQAKHLHWIVVGPGFAVLHAELDAVNATASLFADAVAERMRALTGVPNGRSIDFARGTLLPTAPAGLQDVPVAAAHMVASLQCVSETLATWSRIVDQYDPASADVLNAAILALDKHAWMLTANRYA